MLRRRGSYRKGGARKRSSLVGSIKFLLDDEGYDRGGVFDRAKNAQKPTQGGRYDPQGPLSVSKKTPPQKEGIALSPQELKKRALLQKKRLAEKTDTSLRSLDKQPTSLKDPWYVWFYFKKMGPFINTPSPELKFSFSTLLPHNF